MTTRNWLYLVLHVVVVLLGAYIVAVGLPYTESSVSNGIGTSLIATGAAGWVIFLYVLTSSRASARIALLEEAGLREVFPRRAAAIKAKYDERLAKAGRHIDIVGCGLRALREDYAGSFPQWLERAPVRILLLDPEFPSTRFSLADMRDREEGASIGTIRTDVRAFLRAVVPIKDDPRFTVRLYRAIPAVNYFRVDDEAFWGPYFVGNASRNMPTLLVHSGSFLFRNLEEHFDQLWNQSSRDVPREMFEG